MTTPAGADYRDRRTGLIVFGIAEIVIGLLCGLAILLMLAGQITSPRGPDGPQPKMIFSAIAVYAMCGGAFIWLGIGSVLAQRWARAILLCLSSVGFCVGMLACVTMCFILPRMFDAMAGGGHPALPPGALRVAEVAAVSVILVVYILIPGSIFLFYRSPHVKRTCEVHDPVERWTDRCPLPVLAYCLLLGFGGIFTLSLLGSFRGFPVFGFFVSGGAGYLLLFLIVVFLFYLARGLYRLELRAWWMALGTLLFYAASSAVTVLGSDLNELYAKMGLDPRSAALASHMLETYRWLLPLAFLPWAIWLLWIRRYFTTQGAPPVLTDGAPPVL